MNFQDSRRKAWLLSFALSWGYCAQASAAIPAGERAALDSIFANTNGTSWLDRTGWESAIGTECTWRGVGCTTAGDHVVSIELSNNGLSGTLPALTPFSQLRAFNVSNNQIGGTLPSLTGLSKLQVVYFSNNQFVGALPAIAGLPSLTNFFAENDHLTGTIPALVNLPTLQGFFVEGNQLIGEIPDLSQLPNLGQVDVSRNQLTGRLPALNQAKNLGYFEANSNQLTGPIPDLTGLSNLANFDVSQNQLTGNVPAITGSSALRLFRVDNNQLTGSIPSLLGLNSLQYLGLGGNGLTGSVPDNVPTALVAGQSTLCNNPLAKTPNAAWDTATGASPWYGSCTSTFAAVVQSVADASAATGTISTFNVSIAPSGKAATGATGFATISDTQGNLLCHILLNNYAGSCDAILRGGTSDLVIGYSGNASLSAASTGFSKTIPVPPQGNLNQHGWTGTWYNPATSGQGIIFEVYPGASGSGLIAGGWFTYDVSAGGEDHKRWYTLTGGVTSTSPSATLQINGVTGGNFNAGPVINSANGFQVVGTATINFSDCGHGSLTYFFTDGTGRVGSVPLTRLDQNVTCDPVNGNGNGNPAGSYLLSGAWYTPSTSGQGILFDINPLQNITFGAWYTFAPNGQSISGGASQRWYTLQLGSAVGSGATLTNVGIFSAQGGTFNAPGGVTTPQVGSATMTFSDCNHMALDFTFSSGTNAGRSGRINLQRVGPTPAGCAL